MATTNLEDLVELLRSWGVFDVIIPFILIFSIVYAVLDKTSVFGKDKKNINAVIALVVALSTVVSHVLRIYSTGRDPVDIIALAAPRIALILVVAVCFFILAGLAGIKPDDYKDANYSIITLALLNVFVISAYPSLANFFLIVSVFLIAITLAMGGGKGVFGRIPVIAVVIVFMVFHWAITGWTQSSLPGWLTWLESAEFQTLIIGVLCCIAIISFVTREKKD
jgi:hypothetical protein